MAFFLYGAVVVVSADCCSFLRTQEAMDSTQMTNGGLLAHGVIAPYDVSASGTLSGARSCLIRMRCPFHSDAPLAFYIHCCAALHARRLAEARGSLRGKLTS